MGRFIDLDTPGSTPVDPRIADIRTRGFNWDFDKFPITNIHGAYPGSVSAAFPLESYHKEAFNGTVYYCDIATGNDSNNGLSTGAKKKSIASCITAGNATGRPYLVVVTAGTYSRANSFNATQPTQKSAFIVEGGRADVGTFDLLETTVGAWVSVGSGVYSNTRTNVNRVFDKRSTATYGGYTELTKVADLTACTSTPGSWAQVSSTLYVHLSDDAAVTDTNTRVYVGNVNLCGFATGTAYDIFLSGFDLSGGIVSPLRCSVRGANYIMARDCTFQYAGGALSYDSANGVTINYLKELAAFVDCSANYNSTDGFNIHNYSSGTYTSRMLTINCQGINNGRGTSQSNNGLTAHEDCVLLDINGLYRYNYGGTVHIIDSAQAWCIGTRALNSFGDVSLGGGTSPAEFKAAGTSKMWLDSTRAEATSMASYAMTATSSANIYKRGHEAKRGIEFTSGDARILNY